MVGQSMDMALTPAFSSMILSVINALALLTALALTTIILWGCYNVFLHPLAKYPGPRLWAAYRLPYVVSGIRGHLPFKVLELHRKYKSAVIRIAPDELSFTDPEAWNDIYGLQNDRIQNRKDRAVYSPPSPDAEVSMVHTSNDAVHAKLRRIFGPAFTPKAVDELSGMLLKYSNLLVEQLRVATRSDAVQDMAAWFNFATFDFTGDFVLGEAFHCLDRGGEYHFFVRTIFNGIVAGLQMQQLNRYGIVTLLKPLVPKSMMKAKQDMDRYTKEHFDRRMSKGVIEGRTDVLNYVLTNKNPDDQLSRPLLYENGFTIIVAGAETTATLLTGTLYYLSRHPEKLKIVQDEVRTTFRTDDQITPQSVNQLSYMLAVLSETMRIFPPAGFGIPRLISSPGGQLVAGNYVPANTRCSIFHYVAYHLEANFARPEEFIPERWLPDAPGEFRNDRREVLQPFMVGPRGCIGKWLAYAEMRILLAKVLWHFDFELADPTWYDRLRLFMVWDKGSLKMRMTPVHA